MKCRSVFLLLPFMFLMLISCVNKTENFSGGINTIRSQFIARESEKEWAAEAGTDISNEKQESDSLVAEGIELSPSIMAVASISLLPVIYPSLDSFGSLDCTNLSARQKSVIDNFCSAIMQRRYDNSLVAPQSLYSLALFIYDIKHEPAFVSYLLGKPFAAGDICQVPIRFFKEHGFMDVLIYLDTSAKDEIIQIQIRSTKAAYGAK